MHQAASVIPDQQSTPQLVTPTIRKTTRQQLPPPTFRKITRQQLHKLVTPDDPEQTISTTCTPQVGEYNIRQWHRSAKSKPTRATSGDGFHSTTSPHRGSEPHVSVSRKWSTRVTESQQAGCKPPPDKSLRPLQRRERHRRPHRPSYPPLITNGRARARHQNQHEPRARHHKRLEQRARQHIQHEQRARQHIQHEQRARQHVQHEQRARHHKRLEQRARQHIQHEQRARQHIQHEQRARQHVQHEQRARHHKRHEQRARQHIWHEPRANQTKQPSPRHINCNPHGRRHQAVSTTASTTLCTPRPDTFIFPARWNPVHRRRQVQTHQTLRTLPPTPSHAPEASPWPSTFAPATSSKKPTTASSPTTTQPHPRIRAIAKFVSDRFVWPNHSNIDATSIASTLAARCISGFGTSLRFVNDQGLNHFADACQQNHQHRVRHVPPSRNKQGLNHFAHADSARPSASSTTRA
jgi:hypothetical protein